MKIGYVTNTNHYRMLAIVIGIGTVLMFCSNIAAYYVGLSTGKKENSIISLEAVIAQQNRDGRIQSEETDTFIGMSTDAYLMQ